MWNKKCIWPSNRYNPIRISWVPWHDHTPAISSGAHRCYMKTFFTLFNDPLVREWFTNHVWLLSVRSSCNSVSSADLESPINSNWSRGIGFNQTIKKWNKLGIIWLFVKFHSCDNLKKLFEWSWIETAKNLWRSRIFFLANIVTSLHAEVCPRRIPICWIKIIKSIPDNLAKAIFLLLGK